MSLRYEEDELMREKLKIEEKLPDDRTKREIHRLEEINGLLKKKIISITMSQSIITKIDKLKHQIGRSRAQLIEDAVRWYLDFTVHKWTPRSIFLDSIRMVLESESLLSLFFSKMTPVDQHELGETAGKKAPIEDIVKIFHGKDVKNPSSRELVFQLMQDKGWGSFRQKNNLLIIENPFYPPPFLKGYIETLLGIDLELVETNVKDNVIFKLI